MSQFPAQTPRAIANRLASQDDDDKGALYIERPDNKRVIITVRSPGQANESKVSVPLDVWRKMLADDVWLLSAARGVEPL